MKGNQNYFDEYSEKEAESNQITQNQTKKNNIKISLEPKQSPHYFNEEYNNYSAKEKENSKANDKSPSNTKKAKISLKNQESDNAQEHSKVKNSNAKKCSNSSLKQDLNDLKDSQDDYEINDFQANLQQEKKKTSKSKKSSSNKYSNGILEEVGNSKFIIRTNFLEDEVEENLSENVNEQPKEDQNYQEDKDEVEDYQIDYKQDKNSNAFNLKKKKPINGKSKNQKKIKNDNFENISKTNQDGNSYASETDNKDNNFNDSGIRRDFYPVNTPPGESTSKGTQQAIQFKNILSSMKVNLSSLNSLLNKKRKKYENSIKQQNESKDKINIFYNDYNNFLIKFFHFNSEGSYDSSNNGYKDFSFGLYEDLGLNEDFKESNTNYFYQQGSSNKNFHEHKNSDQKIIGITPEVIYKIKKYQFDIKNLPKMSTLFESVNNPNEEYYNSQSVNKANINANIDNYLNVKKRPTLSFIENQNRETLKMIEEKRLKFKHLPKSNKEKMDNNNLHKNWNWIVKKEIPKMNKIYIKYKNDLEYNYKKLLTMVNKEVKKKAAKVQRVQKEYNLRAKKLQREMIVFWRKRDKEIIEIKKRKDKYEIEKKKREEELQESIMQKKRLEYLMKQSDIYSFFMHQKLGIAGVENESNESNNDQNQEQIQDENINKENEENEVYDENGYKITKIGDNEVAINPKTNKIIFQSIKVDIDESAAKEGVKEIINKQREKVMQFDQQINRIRTTLGGDEVKTGYIEEIKDEDFALEGLDNPKLAGTASELLEQPKSFLGDLKEYQLKGLRWLDNLYEQGINGILADEMGLGKTIQAISLLAHLSEDKNNWGPFLVVAPNATLYNWQQEINKFCPSLKVLPYWGALKERKTLRKFFTTNQLYTRNAAFHVCITSYQLVVSDDKVFNRVSWQYMILDEAQAIKNINSQRWNTLLGFNCRNRLLLSGTPIQNSMSELWALLHFIMPNLFDSHEQFQEWFSRDIEAHSQEKGELNQEQLKRLHKILKPFMLRRVKKDVENEIGPKTEHEILCKMTERQRVLYNSIKEKLTNISDLFSSVDSKVKVENLMNLVMQFRKVCNHPELFERHIGKVPFVFRDLVLLRTSTFLNANNVADLRCDTTNIIKFTLPKLIYDECYDIQKFNLEKYSIFKNKYSSLFDNDNKAKEKFTGLFNFVHLFKFSKNEFLNLINSDTLINHISILHYLKEVSQKSFYFKNLEILNDCDNNSNDVEMKLSSNSDDENTLHAFSYLNKFFYKSRRSKLGSRYFNIFINKFIYCDNEEMNFLRRVYYPENSDPLPNLIFNSIREIKDNLFYPEFNHHRIHIPKAISFPQDVVCSSNRFYREHTNKMDNPEMNQILYGKNFKIYNRAPIKKIEKYFNFLNMQNNEYIEKIIEEGVLSDLFYKYEGFAEIELPSFEKLISDCSKLKKLDELLCELKKNDHRVLIFCQMTRMIDILEEYMAKRRYSYFRMDGSTNIADRRDMVNEFQTNRKIFAFLLSTRAGGLGVNLTGADTVIFYDNDWNPTMDAQATDRAHRIGQTRPVGVYRLITKDTIEERILKRAKQKQNVQTTVYAGGAFKADIFKQSEIVELLYSEEEVKKLEAERKRMSDANSNPLQDVNGKNIENFNADGSKAKDSKCKSKGGKKISKTQEKSSKTKKGQVTKEVDIKEVEKIGEFDRKENAQKSIFSVSAGAAKKNIFNTLRCDSSDDENNIIIQDGENPINIDDDGFDGDE